ncbi:MAG: lipopolysaccharide assembly protein LapA domain-containing protein [Bacillota bacterium]|nr:lipopolysaccharide assembly protein LapA domain-containing protein [Bacillota bacterium]MDW7685087.1 lipopolysaccharide assembly protein LapA domain-containing protein [Bacillota bacterium]
MQMSVIVGLVFGFVIAFFAFLNTDPVTVNYFFGTVEASVAVIVVASAAMGALAVGLFGVITQIRTGFTMWDYRNKVKRLSREVEDLKEQKRALSDDLSFVNAECEQVLKQKEAELEECQEEEKMPVVGDDNGEDNKKDNEAGEKESDAL